MANNNPTILINGYTEKKDMPIAEGKKPTQQMKSKKAPGLRNMLIMAAPEQATLFTRCLKGEMSQENGSQHLYYRYTKKVVGQGVKITEVLVF